MTAATTIVWFRRDLRLADHPALTAAVGESLDQGGAETGAGGASGGWAGGDETGHRGQVLSLAGRREPGEVVGLFVLDDRLRGPAGSPRLAFLYRCLRALDESMGGRLVVRLGDPVQVVPEVAEEVDARAVFVSGDFGPYGAARDRAVGEALATRGRNFRPVGSPYAVEPGVLTRADGRGFRVFGPFHREWLAHGWGLPLPCPSSLRWAEGLASEAVPADPEVGANLPPAGEAAGQERLERFLTTLGSYGDGRDRPDQDATSRLSPYLKYGCLHPRQVLARLGPGRSDARLRTELAWRDFYADVVWHQPRSVCQPLVAAMKRLRYDEGPRADRRFGAWAEGETGFPLVDAGMRQLQAEAWMHNRVRMVVASFLVKDLHLDWRRGARWFMQHLVDGDLASNQHGWQWVAGTGTDPVPYYRVFNPVTQSKSFDPDGSYIRRYVRELAELEAPAVHEPWKLPSGPPNGYPRPLVDHKAERVEALARWEAVRGSAE